MTALSTALRGSTSKGFVVKPNGQARMRYKWDDTIVEVYLAPKAGGKSSIVAVSKKLGKTSGVAVDESAKASGSIGDTRGLRPSRSGMTLFAPLGHQARSGTAGRLPIELLLDQQPERRLHRFVSSGFHPGRRAYGHR